jgi:cytochrome c oxidase subunit 4
MTTTIPTGAAPAAQGETLAHPVPFRVLASVFAALLAFTALTVAATWIDLGNFSLLVAMAIATIKASLVALYFMHLRYDNLFYGFIFLVGLVFVGLFISLALLDTFQYQPDIQSAPPSAAAFSHSLRAPASA